MSTETQSKHIRTQKLQLLTLAIVSVFTLTLFSPVAVLALDDTTPATNNDATVSTAEVASALRGVDGVLAAADQTVTTSDADSALNAAVAGAVIDIPKDADQGVTLNSTTGSNTAIDIELPNAADARNAQRVAPGTVAYAGDNGSASAVQATEDGGVRMLTVIDRPDAPISYEYNVKVPSGGHIKIATDGGAILLDEQSNPLASVAQPWAKDAKDRQIKTYFTTDGKTLTQHVEHNVSGVAYPVVADPIWFVVSEQYSGGLSIAVALEASSGLYLNMSEGAVLPVLLRLPVQRGA